MNIIIIKKMNHNYMFIKYLEVLLKILIKNVKVQVVVVVVVVVVVLFVDVVLVVDLVLKKL